MKTINLIGVVSLLALSLIANHSFAIEGSADQQVEIKQSVAHGIQVVELKNGPLADFYELVAQHPKQDLSAKQLVAANKAIAGKAIENQPKPFDADVERMQIQAVKTESTQTKRILDKLPQHSAK